jgi:hypothetical protein
MADQQPQVPQVPDNPNAVQAALQVQPVVVPVAVADAGAVVADGPVEEPPHALPVGCFL